MHRNKWYSFELDVYFALKMFIEKCKKLKFSSKKKFHFIRRVQAGKKKEIKNPFTNHFDFRFAPSQLPYFDIRNWRENDTHHQYKNALILLTSTVKIQLILNHSKRKSSFCANNKKKNYSISVDDNCFDHNFRWLCKRKQRIHRCWYCNCIRLLRLIWF